MEPAGSSVDRNSRRYPSYEVVAKYFNLYNGVLYSKRNIKPIHAEVVSIEGRRVRSEQVRYLLIHGVWPLQRKVIRHERASTFSVTLTAKEKEQLTNYAQRHNRSLSSVVRAALNQYLRKHHAASLTAPVEQDHQASADR
jgi:hypothetical protein